MVESSKLVQRSDINQLKDDEVNDTADKHAVDRLVTVPLFHDACQAG